MRLGCFERRLFMTFALLAENDPVSFSFLPLGVELHSTNGDSRYFLLKHHPATSKRAPTLKAQLRDGCCRQARRQRCLLRHKVVPRTLPKAE